MFDPQTSGGLLVAVAQDAARAAVDALARAGVVAQPVGEVLEQAGSRANLAVILR
jgi:selenophosphate synthase